MERRSARRGNPLARRTFAARERFGMKGACRVRHPAALAEQARPPLLVGFLELDVRLYGVMSFAAPATRAPAFGTRLRGGVLYYGVS
jgi:hypothetical protein